jgi:DNA-binding response OmpR family regulator
MVGSPQILLVEDEALVASLVTDILDDLGYGVIGAATAKAALELAAAGIGKMSLAIVDLGLPDRRGEEVVAELRLLRSDLPILVTTGYDEIPNHPRFEGLDRLTTIRKPYTFDELRLAIDYLTTSDNHAASRAQ